MVLNMKHQCQHAPESSLNSSHLFLVVTFRSSSEELEALESSELDPESDDDDAAAQNRDMLVLLLLLLFS